MVFTKYADHPPFYRLEDVFARNGVELSRSTLCRWATQAAPILEPIYQATVELVHSSDSIHNDDTLVPVLDASLPKTNGPTLSLLQRLAESLHSVRLHEEPQARRTYDLLKRL